MASTSRCSVHVNRTPLDPPVWIMSHRQVSMSLPESCKRLWESKPPGSEKPIREGQADSRVFSPSPWARVIRVCADPLGITRKQFCSVPPPPLHHQKHPCHPRSGWGPSLRTAWLPFMSFVFLGLRWGWWSGKSLLVSLRLGQARHV